jgi:hypothetical protein
VQEEKTGLFKETEEKELAWNLGDMAEDDWGSC